MAKGYGRTGVSFNLSREKLEQIIRKGGCGVMIVVKDVELSAHSLVNPEISNEDIDTIYKSMLHYSAHKEIDAKYGCSGMIVIEANI